MALVRSRQGAASGIRRLVDSAEFPEPELLLLSLQTRGKALGPGDGFCWGVIPPLVCEDAGGSAEWAMPLAAAVECLMAAADVFDDLQDQDNPTAFWRPWGPAVAMNLANLLVLLAYRALEGLAGSGARGRRARSAIGALIEGAVRACAGQHADIVDSAIASASEEWYMAMIKLKSGAPVAGLCRAAATLATDDLAAIQRYAEFGSNLGMALQIADDVAALTVEADQRPDLGCRATTLPVIFARHFAPQQSSGEMDRLLSAAPSASSTAHNADAVRRILAECGAIQYALAVGDVYFEKASRCLNPEGDHGLRELLQLVRKDE